MYSNDWRTREDALVRTFAFEDFSEAFGFLTRVALIAEAQGHHPEIHNVWNRVTLRLTTHDAGNSITEKDRTLAAAIDKVVP